MALAIKAEGYQRILEDRHLAPEGLVVYKRIRGAEEVGPWAPLDSPRAESYGNLSDGAAWTGCYLASQAFRYAVTGEEAALGQVGKGLSGLEFLTEITGVEGLYARCFERAVSPSSYERNSQEWRQGRGRFSLYRYRGDLSKDQIASLIFGLVTTYDLCPDPRIRRRCERQLVGIADHLLEHGFRIRDEDGRTTRFGDLRGRIAGLPIGVNALIVLAGLKAADHVSGEQRFREAYREVGGQGYLEACRWAKIQLFGKTNHNNDLMAALSFYSLLRLETEPRPRSFLLGGIEDLYGWIGPERNALYAGIYCGLVRRRPDWIEEALDSLDGFPADKVARPIDLTGHPEIRQGFWKNRKGIPKATHPLPLRLRPMTSFVWRSCPYALVRRSNLDFAQVFAGVDYLLAYWLGRYHGLVPAPSGAAGSPGKSPAEKCYTP